MRKLFTNALRSVAVAAAVAACSISNAAVLYGSAYSNSASSSKLYTVDTASGAATLVGGDAIAYFPGLAFSANGALFGSGSSLWSIDRTTGHATSIGALPELMVSIAFDPQGSLWGVGNGSGTLWKLDPASGTALSAGFLSGLGAGGIRSIAFNANGVLFGIGQGVLYNINTTHVCSHHHCECHAMLHRQRSHLFV